MGRWLTLSHLTGARFTSKMLINILNVELQLSVLRKKFCLPSDMILMLCPFFSSDRSSNDGSDNEEVLIFI